MQLSLLPDSAASRLYERTKQKAWQELKMTATIIGKYRHIFTGSDRPERDDILDLMAENEIKQRMARTLINRQNYVDAIKLLGTVVY